MINIENTDIDGVKIVSPIIHKDNRGYFLESYNHSNFKLANSSILFVQDNESSSRLGTLRGIHFQTGVHQQSKLVRVVKGKIQEIAIDLRFDSPTYKKYISIVLDDKNKKQLFIPKGFGHAFLVLSDFSIVSYKVDEYYNQEYESGIKYNDPTLNIKWQLNDKDLIISDRDKNLPYL